jgi:putative molybdopterin biosynthesis protein
MVEHTVPIEGGVLVSRPVVPGENISYAGSDIGRGEFVARTGTTLSARETGVLASVGLDRVQAWKRPRVVVISTGDEIVAPGSQLALGQVYDSNQRILLDTITELGAIATPGGIIADRSLLLRAELERLLADDGTDMVVLSGGTSKGEGDLNAQVVSALGEEDEDWPGIVVHGVALKPGKPLLLAVLAGKPVVVLPGFPTSAVFTFHEFVAPLIRRMGGDRAGAGSIVTAVAPLRIGGAPGRTSYVLVDLVESSGGIVAYPLGAGSGSVTAFSRADGFIRIPSTTEYVEEGAVLDVRLIDPRVRLADLVVIGSHCVGLDHLIGLVSGQGYAVKMIPVGSQAGLSALARGEGDVAGVHLLDEETGTYNLPFAPDGVQVVKGYGRRQGVAFRAEDPEFSVGEPEFLETIRGSQRRMVNRNRGAGTRVLIDALLDGARPDGYLHQARTHHAVAAAIEQGRADWGMTLETVARAAGLGFRFVANEEFDLAVREDRADKPAVRALLALLVDPGVRSELRDLGFET